MIKEKERNVHKNVSKMPYLPPDFIKTTVLIAIGEKIPESDQIKYKPLGTGFLIQPKNRMYLVTANHV